MPTFDLFNRPVLQIAPIVSPLQLIQSSHHNDLLLENRNQHFYTELNANTNAGGGGIESHYLADSSVMSRKINLQCGSVFTANSKAKTPSFIAPVNTIWTSANFGFFTIVWEKPFMWCEFDFNALASMNCILASPLKQSFDASCEVFANTTGGQISIGSFSFNEYDGDFKFVRKNWGSQDLNSGNNTDQGTFQYVQSKYEKVLYQNTTGQASTQFYFRASIRNETQAALGGSATPNDGSVIIRKVHYKTFNAIHS
jgi:hypothetical protein